MLLTRFDIFSFDLNPEGPEDEEGMLNTVHSLNQLITAEVDGSIPEDRIVIGGFSQGGTISLLTAGTSERKLAGAAVLSGRLVLRKKFKDVRVVHLLP